MITMKGLPLAYSKDMQDDKPPVFEAASLLALSIAAMAGMVAEASSAPSACAARPSWATPRQRTWPTGCAAGQHPVPRGPSHHRQRGEAGRKPGIALDQLPLEDLKAIDARIDERVYAALSVEASVAARCSHGGTAPPR
jgi:argininosuccinate lyase